MIKFKNVDFAYSKDKLFDSLNLKFEPGKIYGLLGKNGIGKSTLFKLMQGLLFPKQGSIDVVNHTPSDRNAEMLRKCFLIPEVLLLPPISVSKYMTLMSPFYPNFDQGKFTKFIEDFDLQLKSKLTQMSMGQQKKFMIAFALASNCEILLLDEPTNGLDITSKEKFREMLMEAWNEQACILISTHQVKEVANMIDSICILNNKKVILNETLERISEKVCTEVSFEKPEQPVWMTETRMNEYKYVRKSNGDIKPLDMEIFYQAVIDRSNAVVSLFHGEEK